MTVYLAPSFGAGYQGFTSAGIPNSGGLIYTYQAGTSTPLPTYTSSVGNVANANPIVLGADGRTPNEIWLTAGSSYKFVLTDSLGNILPNGTFDNLSGINDTTAQIQSEWIGTSLTPTYVNATSFTVVGVQTNVFPANRRVQCTVNAGTVYGYVVSATYSNPNTTVVVALDSGSLDSGLSAVNIGLLNSVNLSVPQQLVRAGAPIGGVLLQGKSSSIASASTVDLSTATGNEVHITGNGGPITSFGSPSYAAGPEFTVIFDSNPTVTAGPNLVVQGINSGSSVTVAANDQWKVLWEGSGLWRCTPIGGNLTGKTLAAANGNTVEATSAPSTTPFAFRNKLINGNFDIWQRGTSFASTGYTADRWYCGALSNVTLARGSISDGSATYCLNFTATNATNSSNVYQPIESYTVNTLKGKQVTLSFNITASTGTQTVSYRVRKNATGDTATGGTWSDIGNGTIGATTATQTKSLTVTIPNDGTANGVSVQFDFSNITNGAVISIWAVQLEVGAVATPFETRPYGMELSLCQRYYYRKNAAGGSGVPFCQGFATSTTLMYGWLDFPVPMRVAPAAIEQDGTASDYRIGYAGGATACSAVPAYVAATTFGAMTSFTVASGLTAGQAVLAENAANSPYLGWSAEL